MTELIRVLVMARDPDALDALRRALGAVDAFEWVEREPGGGAAGALESDRFDVVVLELEPGSPGQPPEAALVRARASGQPVVGLAAPAAEGAALGATREGLVDYLRTDQLYPALVQRVLRHAVATQRAERSRRAAESALVESEQRYRSLFEQSRDAIFMTDRSGEVVELNGAAEELLGRGADELLGRDIGTLLASGTDRERIRRELEAEGHVRDVEVRVVRGDGGEAWCLLSAWLRRDPAGSPLGYQGILHDITGRKLMERQLEHEAFHDSLTGLPNRALFMDRLERAVARRRRGEERDLAILFLDLDRFKVVNDSLGHLVGDELLRQMGGLLERHVREEDTVARIGGDEFAILLDGVDDAADPTHVAERIQERLRQPFRLRGHDVFTSVSIGITFGGAGIEKADDLLRDADTAMYRAKEMGPARYQIFDAAMHAHAVTLLQLETDLRLALERQEFVLHYQPVLATGDRRITGFEALVRWQHPSRGLLPPQAFIPVAEETGIIVGLGEWVLGEACRQLRIWQERHVSRRDLFVAVNLSALQFSRTDLCETVRDTLSRTGLPASCLRLELTESVVMHSPDAALQTLRQLREMGVGLCIDDFGTGYSSLDSLHDFPIDTLKIDRSFISRMSTGEGETDLVETILGLARNLGMNAIAEGVETEAQLERLRTLGSTSVQGFLFSSPLDEHAAGALLDDLLAATPDPPPASPPRGDRAAPDPA